jgi:hypothetical protein
MLKQEKHLIQTGKNKPFRQNRFHFDKDKFRIKGCEQDIWQSDFSIKFQSLPV